MLLIWSSLVLLTYLPSLSSPWVFSSGTSYFLHFLGISWRTNDILRRWYDLVLQVFWDSKLLFRLDVTLFGAFTSKACAIMWGNFLCTCALCDIGPICLHACTCEPLWLFHLEGHRNWLWNFMIVIHNTMWFSSTFVNFDREQREICNPTGHLIYRNSIGTSKAL